MHPDFARLHPEPFGHPESTARIHVLLSAFPEHVEAGPATRADLERVHSADYLDNLEHVTDESWIDFDTYVTPTTFEAAMLAAGHTLEAVRRGGFALVRPPGHHASRDRAMGFCLVNNIAVAARYAQAELGLERVAILDWDIHHGNGTESIFWDDPSVFYVSLHAWPYYPGTGGPPDPDEETEDIPGGAGPTTLNIPIPGGTGDREFLQAFEEIACPAIEAFHPDILLASIGFDAHREDPLSPCTLTDDAYHRMANLAAGLAPRFAAVIEGGYNLRTLPRLVETTIAGFEGR